MSRVQFRRIASICAVTAVISVLLLDHSRLFIQILAGITLATSVAGLGFSFVLYEMTVVKRRKGKDESH